MWKQKELDWGRKMKKLYENKPPSIEFYADIDQMVMYKRGLNPSWLELFKVPLVNRARVFQFSSEAKQGRYEL